MEDRLSKFKVNEETYLKFLQRLRHISAVILGYTSVVEPYILIYPDPVEYEDATGYVHFFGEIPRIIYGAINLEMRFPIDFVDNTTDEDIIRWRDTVLLNQSKGDKSHD